MKCPMTGQENHIIILYSRVTLVFISYVHDYGFPSGNRVVSGCVDMGNDISLIYSNVLTVLVKTVHKHNV
jgi:hypothetical protein